MQPSRVLIVEDDGIVAQHLKRTLERFGYEVAATADTGAEALNLAREMHLDLALLDLQLAGEMDGVQVAEQFRDDFDLPVVFLTAYHGDQVLQRAKTTHPYGYITKPFEDHQLYATLELALQKHQLERELRSSQNRYQAVASQSSDAIVLIEAEFAAVVEANPAFERISGIPVAQALGRHICDVFGLPRATFQASVDRLERDRQVRIPAFCYSQPGGQELYLEITGSLVQSAGQLLLCVIARDVTETYQTQLALRRMQEELESQVRLRTAELDQVNWQLRALLDGIPDMAWLKDLEGRFVAVNQMFAQLYDRPAAQIVGKTDLDMVSEELAESYRADDREVVLTGRQKRVEERFIDKTGREGWIETVKVPVINGQGQVTGTVGIAHDVTLRREAENALRRSHAELGEMVRLRTQALQTLNEQLEIEIAERRRAEQAYRGIFDNAAIGIARSTLAGRYLIVNPAMARIFGYASPEEMKAEISDIASQLYLEPNKRDRLIEQAQRVPGFIEVEVEYRRKDGGVFIGLLNLQISHDEQGQVDGMDVFVQDITARKQAEKAILQSEQRYRDIYHKTPVMLHSIDRDGRLMSVSDFWLEMMGFSREEAIGRLSTDFFTPDSRRYAQEVVLPAFFRSGRCKDVPYQIVKKNGEVLDVLLTGVGERDEYGKVVSSLAVLVDVTARNRAEAELQLQIRRLASLRAVQLSITARMDLRSTLDTLLEQVQIQLGVDAACVLLMNSRSQTLEDAADRGFRTANIKSTHLHMGEGLAGMAAMDRRTMTANNLGSRDEAERYVPYLLPEGFVAYYGVPLIVKGIVKGVLEVYHRSLLSPQSEWLQYLEALAGQAAMAIDNVALFEEQQRANQALTRAYDATIEGWSHALELRDQGTEGHTQRVTRLTLDLARYLGYPAEEMDHLRRGTLLHDIGKMGIPDGILLKADRLTDEEWQVMRKHPQYAFEWLSPIDFLRPALDIPYCHHERWDGKGYPRGLKGLQIPLGARIFAVIDVWDSLCSDRPYRPQMKPVEARNYILENKGKHFDPDVVAGFMNMLETSA